MKWLFLFFTLSLAAQPSLPKPVSFTWDAPTNMANVIGYELQWGTGFAQLSTNILEFTAPNFPLAFKQEVGVLSLAANGPHSITNKIWVANYIAYHEESIDGGVTWTVKKEEQTTFERSSNSLIMVRLEIKQPTNSGN